MPDTVPLTGLDERLLYLMRTRGHAPVVERAVLNYSRLGEHSYVWFALAGAGYVLQPTRRREHARVLRVLVVTELANAALKRVFRRERPRLEGLPALMTTRSALSYPSAHAATSLAAARTMSAVLPSAPLYAAAVLMACSRPYLGVHYPSDVAAGALLGIALAELVP